MSLITNRYLRMLLCLAIGLALQLHAATAKDIQGEWIVDPEATWNNFKKHPDLADSTSLQAEETRKKIVKGLVGLVFNIELDRIVVSLNGKIQEINIYKVVSVIGDKVEIEAIGKSTLPEKSELTVKGDTLVLVNENQPGLVMKRKATTK